MLKVRVVENSWFAGMIVGKNITIYPFIFLIYDKQTSINTFILQHEYIHILQVRKLGWLKFYSSYILEYLKNLWKYKNFEQAYENISYEVEAYKGMYTQQLPDPLV